MTQLASRTSSPTLDDRFLLVVAIGRGGHGRVYRAYDRVERREVAIKVVPRDPDDPTRPPSEGEFAAWIRLRHPNVVRAYELGYARTGPLPRGSAYLVLELVRGVPVHRALAPGRIPGAVLEEVARRALRALDHVHRASLVHRDLKPGNVLVTPSRRGCGRLKLTDFGLASQTGQASEPGRVSGSLPYLSPESILGEALDGRADLYGLGILLYFLASGRLPLSARAPEHWLRWHLDGPPVDLARAGTPASPRLSAVVSRLTSRDRDARYPTAAEALSALGPAGPPGPASASASLPAGERAALRFAIDAARRGERRALRCPARPGAERAVRHELQAATAALDVSLARIARQPAARYANLDRVVLRLLLERGRGVEALVARHHLHRGLPLSLLGGVPVWDRLDRDEGAARGPGTLPVVARGVAEFLLDASRRRALAVLVERSALSDPLAASVTDYLARAIAVSPGPREGAAGLLLVSPDVTCGRSRRPRTPST